MAHIPCLRKAAPSKRANVQPTAVRCITLLLTVKNELAPETVRIALRGEFDMSDKARLTALLLPGEYAETVILDMSETTYIDTTALGCLVRLKKAMIANGGGELHLFGVTPTIRRVLTITKLDTIFQITGSWAGES